jgi:glycosyltransferase involved in cell wall biosynthesis|tara:strand:+ start:89 stop:1045 length:957 start_codon:yes stop_codon:yes gene_type:complete
MIDVSVVVPLFNEEESLPELCKWIAKVMDENNLSYEVLLIDDGSKDKSWQIVAELAKENSNIKGISFRRNYGKSAALNRGFDAVNGEVVITMDADLQDSPDEIPDLRKLIIEDGFDMISGWKKKRYDPITKTIPTKLFNWATRKMSGIELNDFNCGLKAYRYDVVKSVEVYGEMHRYIPVLAKRAGFVKIGEKVVQHRSRKYGTTKFGMERFVNGFLDLLSITFVTRFGKKPMHLFGLLGSLMFFIGFLITLYIGGEKLYYLTQHVKAKLVTEQPVFYIALISMVIGTQMFLAGFIGEMIARNSPERNNYHISDKVNL